MTSAPHSRARSSFSSLPEVTTVRRAERACDLERRGRDSATDPPDQHPFALLELRLGDEHPVGGLVDEREGRGRLEVDRVVEREDLLRRERDQLAVRPVGVLADDGDRGAVLEPRVDDDALARVDPDPRAVGAEDPRLRDRGKPLPDPEVEVVERGRSERDQDLARPGDRIGHVLVAEHLRAAVFVDAYGLHGHDPSMNSAELARLGEELGLDAVGAAPAAPYAETERHIGERNERGLFAGMRFTMAQPEVSCHPEALLPGARTVVSAALCYYAVGPEAGPGEGTLSRYTWSDRYAELRERLDALGRRLGGSYRVLVDANQHVDREGAARAGIGFYGKNTLLITQRHGSWVVLGTLVTDVEIEPSEPLGTDCGSCTLCIDACPTGALNEPGTLDATRCLSYWTQAPKAIPAEYRAAIGASLYGCDICQDVCPWNRGVEKRRAGEAPPAGAEPTVSLVEWLEADGAALVERYERLYVPRNDPRYLRRNALVAAGNVGGAEHGPLLERFAAGDDELLREHAAWALARLEERGEWRPGA